MILATRSDSIYFVSSRKVNETEKSTKGMEQERGENIKIALDSNAITSIVAWKIKESNDANSMKCERPMTYNDIFVYLFIELAFDPLQS